MRRALLILLLLGLSLDMAGPAIAARPELVLPRAIVAAQGIRTLPFGQNSIAGARVATDASGVLQVLLSDGTTITLGRNSELVIDRYRHDPEASSTELRATLRRGVFRFIGTRRPAGAESVVLATPYGSLAVREAGVDIDLGGEGRTPHFDMVFGDEITLTGQGGTATRVYRTGFSIVPGDGGASTRKTPPEWTRAMQRLLTASLSSPRILAGAGQRLFAEQSPG